MEIDVEMFFGEIDLKRTNAMHNKHTLKIFCFF
jgi:hypothetical protein